MRETKLINRGARSMRLAALALLVGGLACATNSANEQVGAAGDSTTTGMSDTATTTEADSVRAW